MKKVFLFLLLAFTATLWNVSRAQTATKYDLFVGGVQVTSDNASAITGEGITGSISYDAASKTLTVKNAKIELQNKKSGIENTGIENLTINLVGDNTFNTKEPGIAVTQNTTISGKGKISVKSENAAIYIFENKNKVLTISGGCTVVAVGKWGISGINGSSGEVLVVNNAIVKATGSLGSIDDLSELRLEGTAKITKPQGAAFDKNKHTIMLNGKEVTSEVVIEYALEVYKLQIATVKVTSENAANITSDSISGKVSYDPTTKTLTLDNAVINTTSERGIYNSGIKDLTIKLVGKNEVNTTKYTGMTIKDNTTITGSGSLKITSNDVGIYVRDANNVLTVDGTTIEIAGNDKGSIHYGISGTNGKKGETLVIKESDVKVIGSKGSICDLTTMTLVNAKISKPQGAAFDNSLHCVAKDGKKVTEEIVIEKMASGTETALADSNINVWNSNGNLNISLRDNKTDGSIQIYAISGQLVRNINNPTTTVSVALPAGTYIVKYGKTATKVVVR